MWIQTSYNTSGGTHNSGDNSKALRGNYAGIGHIWDEDNNIFYGKKTLCIVGIKYYNS